jgi:hypothetical protein
MYTDKHLWLGAQIPEHSGHSLRGKEFVVYVVGKKIKKYLLMQVGITASFRILLA